MADGDEGGSLVLEEQEEQDEQVQEEHEVQEEQQEQEEEEEEVQEEVHMVEPASREKAQACCVTREVAMSNAEAWRAAAVEERAVEQHALARTEHPKEVVCAVCLGHLDEHQTEEEKKKLYEAALNGQGDVLRQHLEQGGDPSHLDAQGRTALFGAARGGNVEVAKMLLDAGVDVTVDVPQFQTALEQAASAGHAAVVELLVRAWPSAVGVLERLVALASKKRVSLKPADLVRLMLFSMQRALDAGEEVNDEVEPMSEGRAWNRALRFALKARRAQAFSEMCKLTKQLHAESAENPLRGRGLVAHAMAMYANESLEELLRDGLDAGEVGANGQTALHYAAVVDDDNSVKRLVGITDPNVLSAEGETPLVYAVQRGSWSSAKVLLQAGSNPNATNKDAKPLLHVAAKHGSVTIVQQLLQYGALATADFNGRRASAVARTKGARACLVRAEALEMSLLPLLLGTVERNDCAVKRAVKHALFDRQAVREVVEFLVE